jgi:AcrR family transcriptional regulator
MEATERREQILTCAMRLFERSSYSEVSTADIATAAGIARPLIHHYFGTKRELYLEVVRRLSYVPAFVVKTIPDGTLEERLDASIDRWLTVAWRHRNMWLATVGSEGLGRDKEIDSIMQQADVVAADRMLEALGLTDVVRTDATLKTLMLAYGGLARTSSRLWLAGDMSRDAIHLLLTRTLLTIINDVAPAVSALAQAPQ